MKMKLTKILGAILVLTLFAAPLHAQTDVANDTPTDEAVAHETNAAKAAASLEQTSPVPPRALNPPWLKNDRGFPANLHGDDMVAVLGVLAVFGGPVIIVGMFFYFRHRKNKMLHDTVRLLVEKGVPIPPELFTQTDPSRSPTTGILSLASTNRRHPNDFRNGLILMGCGAGLTALVGKAGLIAFFIGLAMIIAAFFNRRETTTPPEK